MFKTVDVAADQHGNESAKRGQDNGLAVDFSDAPSASLYGNDAPLPYGASDGSDGQMTSDEAGMEANGSKEGKVVVVKKCDKPQRRISEIRIFYDDQTWETFVPKERSWSALFSFKVEPSSPYSGTIADLVRAICREPHKVDVWAFKTSPLDN